MQGSSKSSQKEEEGKISDNSELMPMDRENYEMAALGKLGTNGYLGLLLDGHTRKLIPVCSVSKNRRFRFERVAIIPQGINDRGPSQIKRHPA
jgi:hypothetical protein